MVGLREKPVASKVHGFLRDCRGSALIEFAAVAGPFIALIFANLETSLMFFSQQMLDTSTEEMARRILTGAEQKAGTSQTQFKQKVCDTLPDYMSCSRLMVDVKKFSSFSGANTGAPALEFDEDGNVTNPMEFQPGSPGDIVVMRVMYRWPAVTGPLGFGLGNLPGGERLLVTTSVFKTERYQ